MRISDWSSDVCSSDLARLVRSTSIPRSIWVNRIVLSKGLEFLFSLPVLVLFAVFGGATVGWGILLFPVAALLLAMLLVGLGLIIAPLGVLFGDLERTTRDRKSVGSGKSVSVRVDLGGR